MSNNIVGNAYRDIIEDVINSSRIDCEDSGVDETTLRELQLLWQERLTISGVVTFPSDQSAAEPESGTREAKVSCETSTSLRYAGSITLTSAAPQIVPRSTMAAMRSAPHIQELASGERVPAEIAGYSVNGVIKDVRLDGMTGLDSSNSTGSLIFGDVSCITQADGGSQELEVSREVVDRLLEGHILRQKFGRSEHATQQPVPQLVPGKREKANLRASDSSDNDSNNDSDDNEDSDAINSDLDDPEDEIHSQGDENEGSDAMMLCLYDRVTRVKNIWKCDFRDGAVHVNGIDYLFETAKGEFEW
ncbi:transcription factor IIA, alpha/beta subunit-domain-containing protein [Lipomyces mesembrius]